MTNILEFPITPEICENTLDLIAANTHKLKHTPLYALLLAEVYDEYGDPVCSADFLRDMGLEMLRMARALQDYEKAYLISRLNRT